MFKKPSAQPHEPVAVEFVPEGMDDAEGAHLLLDMDGVEGIGRGIDPAGLETVNVYVRDRSVIDRLPREVGGKQLIPHVTGVISLE